MSVKVMSRVWDESKAEGSALLLLLAIADHCHDDGTGAWPSIASLAKKTRLGVRNTQYQIRKLEAMGELATVIGGGPMKCNSYVIPLQPIAGVQPVAGVQNSVEGGAIAIAPGGCNLASKGVQWVAPKPSVTITEPSKEPSKEPSGKLASSKPSVEEVKLTAAKSGLPESEALKFHDYYESNGWKVGKNPMRSWVSALANWKRNWIDRGGPERLNGAKRSLTPIELSAVIRTKEERAAGLKSRFSSEVATGAVWQSPDRQNEYIALRKEIRELKTKLEAFA